MTSSPGAGADPDDLHYPLTFNHTVSHDTTTTLPPPPITFLNSPLVVREVLAVVMGVVMVVGFGGNGLLCGMVFRKVTMRSAINLLVAQLAASDVLLTCWVMPLALADLFLPVTLTWGWWLCALEGFLLELLVTLNVCLLLAISADRYLIIIHRKEKLNVRRARVIIVSAWSLSLLFAAPPLLGWGCFATFSSQRVCVRFVTRRASDVAYLVVSCLVTKLLPMAAVLYCYARIVSTVRKKNTKVHHYGVDVSVTHSSGSPPSGGPPHSVGKVSSTACGCAARAVQCPGSQGPHSVTKVSSTACGYAVQAAQCPGSQGPHSVTKVSSTASGSALQTVQCPGSQGPHSMGKVSSTASGSAVRAAQCPRSQGPQSGNTVSFSSSTSVRFVSRDSSVHLHSAHCPAVPLCLSDPGGSQVSSDCSLLGLTVTESVDSSFSPSTPSTVSNVRQPNDLTSSVPCRPDVNDASGSALRGNEPATCKPRSKIFISIKHRPSEPSNGERDLSEPRPTGSGEGGSKRPTDQTLSVSTSCEGDSKQATDQTLSVSTCCTCSGPCTNFVLFEVQPRGPPHRTQCPCSQRPASHVHFESDHSLHGKPAGQCSSMTSGGCRSQGSRPYISSPSGFSSRSNAIRRTAGGRKQVVDMSFKTRAFKTILILSLLLCLCWSPFFIASMLTAMTSSSSSSTSPSSSSSSSSSSTTSSTSSLTPSSPSSSSSPFSSLSLPSSSPCSSSAVVSVVTSSCLMTPTTSSSLISSSSSFSSSSPSTFSFSHSPSSSTHSAQLLSVLLWLGFLKTALNPIVYALRIRKFREAFRLSATPGDCSCWAVGRGCRPCPRWRDLLGKRRVNPSSRYQCG